MYYIGIDIGTSSAKLTLINASGEILKEAGGAYQIDQPQAGWKEINPDVWMQIIEDAMPTLLQGIDSYKVGAIGVTGQMHTLILLDQEGEVIRPALMWNDTRTKAMIPDMKARIKTRPQISYIANIISTGSPASNLLWVKTYEPENFKRINRLLIGPDYIVYRLTGTCQTDYCEASTSSLLDFDTRAWSKDIQELFEFPSTIFPDIKGSNEIAGTISSRWANKFKLHPFVKVLTGTGDNPAAAISTGCFSKRYPVLSIGTSGVLMVPKTKVDFQIKGKHILFSFDAKDITVLVQGAIQSAGNSMSWWTNQILNAEDLRKEASDIDLDALGRNKLLFYPHLAGDKTIHADPELCGAFIGLQTSTTRKEMTTAVMEGIAMAIRQLSEVMQIPKTALEGLRVTGGGSKNDIWMQILADVCNIRIQQLKSGTGAGYGMALSAASVCEKDLSLEDIIEQNIHINKVFSPRETHVQLYQKKYEQYLKIYQAIQSIYTD